MFLALVVALIPATRYGNRRRPVEGNSDHDVAKAEECFGENDRFVIKEIGGLRWHVRREFWSDSLRAILEDPELCLLARARILKRRRSRTVGRVDGFVIKRYAFRSLKTSLADLFRPSYALRAFLKSYQLERSGIPAPKAVCAAEHRTHRLLWRSYFVMQELPAIRGLDELNGERDRVIRDVAECLADLHARGFSHRDLRQRNLVYNGDGRVHLLDMEQVRYVGQVTPRCAVADLAWLARDLPELSQISMSDCKRFLRLYCELRNISDWRTWWRNIAKRVAHLNAGGRGAKHRPPSARAAANGTRAIHQLIELPPAPAHPPFWHPYSDQPRRLPRSLRRHLTADNLKEYLAIVTTSAAVAPLVAWRYLTVQPTEPRPAGKSFVGLSISPSPSYDDEIEEMVSDLGVEELLVRIPTWELDRLDDYERFLRRFPNNRFLVNILQCREVVLNPEGWRRALRQIFERFQQITPYFQIGNASDRIKWGCSNIGEYLTLLDIAQEVRADFPGVKLIGSSVIDFAPLFSVRTLVNFHRYHLDVASSLLYVNRRGSPFNFQCGGTFDLERKIRLLRAIAGISNRSQDRLWITEMNWPLLDTKPWTPNSGNSRSTVDEETQARYLREYYQIAYQTGLVEKVYWWQLIAPGYGLVDHRSGRLRKRPAYHAFRELLHSDVLQQAPPPGPSSDTLPPAPSVPVHEGARSSASATMEPVAARLATAARREPDDPRE